MQRLTEDEGFMLDRSEVLSNFTNMLAAANYQSIELPGSFILAMVLITVDLGARLRVSLNH